jgi:uroporphyrinogen-III synthase
VRRRRVAVIGARGGRDVLARELRARGARLQQIEVYRRRAPRLGRSHFLQLEQAAGPLLSLFSSAAALGHLHALLPAPLFAHLAAGECIVSSERLAEVARTLGFARIHVAASPAPAALLAAACAALARHRL